MYVQLWNQYFPLEIRFSLGETMKQEVWKMHHSVMLSFTVIKILGLGYMTSRDMTSL